jgi:osmotically-inducible protein OsmY
MESRIARLVPVTVGVLGLATLWGCASSQASGDVAARAPDTVVRTAPVSRSEDSAISQSIREKLAEELPGAAIEVATDHGKVALTGTVADSEAARKAIKGALAVEGVRGVVNDLDVEPGAAGASATLSAAATP